jgi:hypothetical protein
MSARRVAQILGLAAVMGLVAFADPIGHAIVPDAPQSSSLIPCATEDSDNCWWDAQNMGNGTGTSFEVRDGVVTYIETNGRPHCTEASLTNGETCWGEPE